MQLAELASADVIIIVVLVIALVFGSSKIPKIARGLGSAKSEFEKGVKEGQSAEPAAQAPPAVAPAPAPAPAPTPVADEAKTDNPAS